MAGATVYAHEGDTLDKVLYRAYAQTAVITEEALGINRGIADLGPILPQGTAVILPDPPTSSGKQETVQLWS